MQVSSLAITNMINWAIIGLIIGFTVHLIDYRSLRSGLASTLVTAVLGALFGGVAANLTLGLGISGFDFVSAVFSLLGGLVFSIVQRLIFKEKDSAHERGSFDDDLIFYQQVGRGIGEKDGSRKRKNLDTKLTRFAWMQNFLNLVNYPISKRDLIRSAEQMDADELVLSDLESLPDHIYENKDQVEENLDSY